MSEQINTVLINKIGLVVKQLRAEKGVSQRDMYDDTGVHVGRIETSGRNLSISTLSLLADYFEIKLSDFFKLVEKQK
ncbi:helix-turn-helix domain-containing protein [Ferruginibacter sp. HRS2-29]|uniref:helix-turn-helix domain-containing protein n=1 Tax=Ferruginibacter sp. HRS2-29 TaxID=2487334 RepID=UPI0020CE8886|nr:helix-turn-helix transcriptional regulator [Ferruginibacter sp. HRS2-29]MCP9750174.1 XRE family transcriptional regulator [Ferruginibacter sp. HRS2-29]